MIRFLYRPLLALGFPAPMRFVKPLPRDADSFVLGAGQIECWDGKKWIARLWFDFGRPLKDWPDGITPDSMFRWWRRKRSL